MAAEGEASETRALVHARPAVDACCADLDPRQRRQWSEWIAREVAGVGALTDILADATVSEILIQGATLIELRRDGVRARHPTRFSCAQALELALQRMIGAAPSESQPVVDGVNQLPALGEVAVHAVGRPLVHGGPVVLLSRPQAGPRSLADLVTHGQLSAEAAGVLEDAAMRGANLLVCGPPGLDCSGWLAAVAAGVPEACRVVAVHRGMIARALVDRAIVVDGARDLAGALTSALRLRPDALVVHEVGAAGVDRGTGVDQRTGLAGGLALRSHGRGAASEGAGEAGRRHEHRRRRRRRRRRGSRQRLIREGPGPRPRRLDRDLDGSRPAMQLRGRAEGLLRRGLRLGLVQLGQQIGLGEFAGLLAELLEFGGCDLGQVVPTTSPGPADSPPSPPRSAARPGSHPRSASARASATSSPADPTTTTGWLGCAEQPIWRSPTADGVVTTLAASGATLFAGGDFATFGGQARQRLAAYDTQSDSVTAWAPGADAPVLPKPVPQEGAQRMQGFGLGQWGLRRSSMQQRRGDRGRQDRGGRWGTASCPSCWRRGRWSPARRPRAPRRSRRRTRRAGPRWWRRAAPDPRRRRWPGGSSRRPRRG